MGARLFWSTLYLHNCTSSGYTVILDCQKLLIHFYSATFQSVLCTSITGLALPPNWKQQAAENISGTNLPIIQDLYQYRLRKKAGNISAEPSHFRHKLLRQMIQSAVCQNKTQIKSRKSKQ